MLPFTLTMNKYGLGREVGEEGAEEASVMHGPRKSTCMLLSLSLRDTLDTYTCRLLHEFYGVVVCRLKNMGSHSITFASTFRISSHVQN